MGLRLNRLQATREQMKSLQKEQEEQSQIQQQLKQQEKLTPQVGLAVPVQQQLKHQDLLTPQVGLAVPVLLAANGGVMRPMLLPTTMMQQAVHDVEAPVMAPAPA